MKPVIAILFLAIAGAAAHAQDRHLGTALEWEGSIEQAADLARKEGKLVLALQVSGQFDQPEFT
jgi:hypothetical protein